MGMDSNEHKNNENNIIHRNLTLLLWGAESVQAPQGLNHQLFVINHLS